MKKYCLFVAVLLMALCVAIGVYAEPNGWVKEEDYLFYYSNGIKLTGTQTIGGKLMTFADNGALVGNGKIQEVNGGIYFINSQNKIEYKATTCHCNNLYRALHQLQCMLYYEI